MSWSFLSVFPLTFLLLRLFCIPFLFPSWPLSLDLLPSVPSLPSSIFANNSFLFFKCSVLLCINKGTKLLLVPIIMLRAGVSGWITSISCPAPRDNLTGFTQPLPASPTSISWNTFHSPVLAFLIRNTGNWDFSQFYQNYPQKSLFFIDV